MADSKGYLEVSQDEKPQLEKKKKNIEDFARMGKYAFLVMIFTEFILLCGAGNVFFMLFAGERLKFSNVLPLFYYIFYFYTDAFVTMIYFQEPLLNMSPVKVLIS